MSNVIIDLRHISKAFTIHARSDATILSRMADLVPLGHKRHTTKCIQALSDISLQVRQGEVLGIIGENTSGKSTLLRVIAGILYPDSGFREVNGTITPLINLSVGLRHRLTVRDNIFLACSLYGMQQRTIHNSFASIVGFAGIEQYLDMYPYQLSLGMSQRLSFSIAVHTKPEVLLLDEVFSAGDIAFQEKAKKRMIEMIQGEATVVMVSHNADHVRSLCDTVLWLDRGTVKMIGNAKDVMHAYQEGMKKMSMVEKV